MDKNTIAAILLVGVGLLVISIITKQPKSELANLDKSKLAVPTNNVVSNVSNVLTSWFGIKTKTETAQAQS